MNEINPNKLSVILILMIVIFFVSAMTGHASDVFDYKIKSSNTSTSSLALERYVSLHQYASYENIDVAYSCGKNNK